MNAITLALTIPLIVVTLPSIPLPLALRRRSEELPVSKGVLYLAVVILAMVPQRLMHVLSDIVLVSAFFSTYVLPGPSFKSNLLVQTADSTNSLSHFSRHSHHHA